MEFTQIFTGITIICVLYLMYQYLYVKSSNNYWAKRGIPCIKGALPLIGNKLPMILMRQSYVTLFNDYYQSNPDHSMVGYYNFRTPGLIIRDPELIKTIMLTEFSKFDKNTSSLNHDLDPLLWNHPFFSKGHEWKKNRTIMITGLSSGKLKFMSHQIRDVCLKFTNYLKEQTKTGAITVNFHDDLASRFTAEVVAIAAFGIDGGSFTKFTGTFENMAKLMFRPASFDEFNQLITLFFPFIAKCLHLRFLPRKLDKYFRHVIKNVLESRKQMSTIPIDYLQQVCNMCKKENDNVIDENAITTYSASFFLDGHLTSGMTMSFAAYQIAKHPEVQEKLRSEVLTIFDNYKGELNYEALQNMKYMEQVINESMRLFPAAAYMGKICNESCKLSGYDGLECVIEPGTEVTICNYALHRDPRYWDNPDVFNPERFDDQRKNERLKYVFMPFGCGPRTCIGMRVAMMQIKAALATLLRDYSIEVDPKTKEPLGIHPLSALFTAMSSELWIRIKPLCQ